MRRNWLVTVIFLIVIAWFIFPNSVSAQSWYYDRCRYESGTFYQSDIFPRYEARNRRLILVSWQSGAVVQEIETSFDTSLFEVINWSPNCRYLAATIGEGTGVWDVVHGTRVATLPYVREWLQSGWGAYYYLNRFSWSSESDYVVFGDTELSSFIWHVASGNVLPLVPDLGYGFHQVGWDTEHGHVFTVPRGAGHTVNVYELGTGRQIATFHNLSEAAPVNYALSLDASRIVVFTSENERRWDSRPSAIAVWNRETMTAIHLCADHQDGAAALSSQVAISADNRYVVIARGDIRVWDMHNLYATEEEHLPTYMHEGPTMRRVRIARFVDENILETVNVRGFVQRWDLHTGAEIALE